MVSQGERNFFVKFTTENLTVAKKYSILIKKVFHFDIEMSVRGHQYLIYILNPEDALIFLQALKILEGKALVHELVIQRNCCKRAFIRGIFLACGSVTDPERGYHLEMAVGTIGKAEELVQILADFQIPAKVVERKKNYIVYIKEGALIVDLLNVMEAHVALMEFENVRILKEMRNSVNRQVNCETANIYKTVNAAVKQIEDIRYIEETTGFSSLPEPLEQMARLRLQYPEASLLELGKMLTPVVGKSGVNHRLRKLKEIAEDLRRKQGGEVL